ncbi:MAG TPA: carbohydrate-binding family 9-like protein [Terriglobales bacterium]|nr:carbohydrate-binding family 9-like protein [Terriglobales bacterium]
MNATPGLEADPTVSEIIAAPVEQDFSLDAAHLFPVWQLAQPIEFCKDWRGENPDPGLQTQARLLWSEQALYVRFDCRYRELFLFEDSDASGRRDQLWDRDVAEIFLQPEPSRPRLYKEFEVSPNGMWIDLDISDEAVTGLKSGLERSVFLDKKHHTWAAELAIPMKSLIQKFDPARAWRINFFRIEGPREPRTYHAWKPTMTAEPDFHVPEAFGELRFAVPR